MEQEGGDTGARPVTLPWEWYLRELYRLDITDESAIVQFVSDYGPPRIPSPEGAAVCAAAAAMNVRGMAIYPGEPAFPARDATRALRSFREFVEAHVSRNNRRELDETMVGELRPGGTVGYTRPPRLLDSQLTVHIEEVRVAVALIRDLTRLALAVSGSMAFAEVQQRWESPFRPLVPGEPWPLPEEGVSFLVTALGQALEPFHVHIEWHRGEGERPFGALASAPTYACLCLQLANHIAEHAEYKVCQNENCGRLFVRQQGGAKFGQYRTTGRVLYCSVACSNAAAQRRLRAKKRLSEKGNE
jgi:hypothetical protein